MMGGSIRCDDERIRQELEIMGIKDNLIKTRIWQIQQNRQISTCVEGANVILKFQEEYELQGDFEPIKKIASVSV